MLYDLIGKHIPKDIDEDTEILNFIGRIIDSIIRSGEHERYIDVISLVTGETRSSLLSKPIEELMVSFSEGLIGNHVLLLCKFCEELGYG